MSRDEWEKALRRELPDFVLEHLDAALRDEPGEGESLLVAAPNEWRGLLAVFFWLHAPETNAFRDVLLGAWLHDHREVIAAVATRRELENIFKAARFELPDEMPETVTLYRGTSFLPASIAKRGYAWTTDKKVAAFFAMRFVGKNGQPLVLRATVPKSSILFYSDERCEREAVCFHVRGAKPDGNPEEWQELMNQFKQESSRSQRELMNQLKQQLDVEFGRR